MPTVAQEFAALSNRLKTDGLDTHNATFELAGFRFIHDAYKPSSIYEGQRYAWKLGDALANSGSDNHKILCVDHDRHTIVWLCQPQYDDAKSPETFWKAVEDVMGAPCQDLYGTATAGVASQSAPRRGSTMRDKAQLTPPGAN